MNVEPDLGSIINVICKRRRAAMIAMALPAALGAAYLLIATPKYRSEAAVIVRFDQAAVPTTDMARESTPEVTAANDRREVVEAHTDILTNPDLARQVIEWVGPRRAYPKIYDDPPDIGTPMDWAVLKFEESLVADAEVSGDVINVSFLHPDPKLAQAMLTKLIDLYMKQEAELFSTSDLSFNRKETEQAARRLAAAQADLHDYKARWKISSYDDQVSDLIQQRSDLAASLQNSQVSLEQAVQRRAELTRLLAGTPEKLNNSATEKYRSYDDALSNLAALTQKEKEMMVTYRADSPLLAQLHASIEVSKADVERRRADLTRRDATEPNIVYQNIQTDLLRATADARAFARSVAVQTAQIDGIDQQLGMLESARTGYVDRMRAVEVADNAYRSLALHMEDVRVAQNRLKGGISHGAVLTDASLPYEVAKPRYLILSIAFALGSLLCGVMTAILLEIMDDRFTTPEQVMHTFQLPVLATLDEIH